MTHSRVFNFSAGPAMLPTEVLEASAAALVDFQGKGFGIAEVSHRGKEFESVLNEATARCRALLNLGETHDVLFLQGGATALFSQVPWNLLKRRCDVLVSGEWSKKAAAAAKESKRGEVHVVATSEPTNFDHAPTPEEWRLSDPAEVDYLHVCSNETVHGHRLATWPKHPNLVVDASSEFMSRPHPIADCAVAYAGAQKNLGPSGVVLTIVRRDLYDRLNPDVAKLWNFKALAENKSMINTPPTFGVYVLLEVFRWLDRHGGLAGMERRNAEKAGLIYDAIDGSGGYYTGAVTRREQRSHMNVTFRLPDEDRAKRFAKEAAEAGMPGLAGYRTVGGIRASIYNAMPVEGCRALAQFMGEFMRRNG